VTLYRFILAEKAHFEVRAMCDVFGVAPSRYYEWECKQQSERATKDAELLAAIRVIFAKFRGRYGAPRVHDQLARQDVNVSRKRVARLMREAGLKAKGRRKYKATTDSNHGAPVAPNVLERDFHVECPDAAWVSDITYIWTRQGWMYLAVILDLYSRKVVGWSLAERMTATLVCDALDAAVRLRRPKPGLIFHSDRGSQYASRVFRRRLWRHQMRQSMSRKGDCWDSETMAVCYGTAA
jgi:transposase InsO family protein